MKQTAFVSTKQARPIREVALEALNILDAWELGAEMDAAFDGGEFSGPAASRAADREVTALAVKHGYTLDEVEEELTVIEQETANG
jgi:hypothetical protein